MMLEEIKIGEEVRKKMINRVILVGRLTRDPELKYTPNRTPNLRFTIAVNRTYTNKGGEREADYIYCTAWRGHAENMAKFLRKGALIGLEGRIETDSYQKDGTTQYKTGVVVDNVQFLESKGVSEGRHQQYSNQGTGYSQSQTNQPPTANEYPTNYSNPSFGSNVFPNSQLNNTFIHSQETMSNSVQIHDDDLPF